LFRLTKIAGLLVKTLAKPLSKRIKHEFSRYPVTQRLLINIGQTSHQFSSRMTIWSAGYKVRSITPLEEEKAMKEGAELVGETFILSVSVGWLLWEYNRSKEKENDKESKRRAASKAERDSLQAKLHALDARLKALEVVVKANSESLLNLGPKYVAPAREDIVPIDDTDQSKDLHVLKGNVPTDTSRQATGISVTSSQGEISNGGRWRWPAW
jgi:hypothetical protein